MDKKQMYVQVVNLSAGKIFSLPTLYTDRIEACVCGQNYIRDRQAENIRELIFFRILDVRSDGTVAPSYELWNDEDEDEDEDDETCPHPEQECCEDCPFYSECWYFDDDDEDEDDEEPEHGESVYGNTEEPSSESLAEILSVFNAIRPNY
jgi:hypothetical protein